MERARGARHVKRASASSAIEWSLSRRTQHTSLDSANTTMAQRPGKAGDTTVVDITGDGRLTKKVRRAADPARR